MNLRTFCIYLFSASLILFCPQLNARVQAQPGDQLSDLQSQLKRLQDKIEKIQSSEDPFDSRVRSVGRQRVQPPPPVSDTTLSIRFYDLSDIFSVSPQYPAVRPDEYSAFGQGFFPSSDSAVSGGGFGGGGGVFSIPPAQQQAQTMNLDAARVSVDSLVEAVQRSVEPDKWEDEGGDARVQVLGNTLLISATDSMHQQISNLINLFRDHWGKLKTINVQAFWIRSDAASIRELIGAKNDDAVVGVVPAEQWQEFFRAANAEKLVAYSAMLSGHNGQTLHTLSGNQRHQVVDAVPLTSVIVNKDGDENSYVSGLRPVRRTFLDGAVLQLSPLTTRGGNFVILDIHTQVNELIVESGEESEPPQVVAEGVHGDTLTVPMNRGDYRAYRLSTTVRVPKDQVMLVGGMTFRTAETNESQPDLYLFVKARIHTIQEDLGDRAAEK